jgi:hypothetical protein
MQAPCSPPGQHYPRFKEIYGEVHHGEHLCKELDLSHLDTPVRNQVCKLLQKYWSVFDDKGLFIPVKDYKCSIDTGSARPICVKKINYGPQEIPIMKCCIAFSRSLSISAKSTVANRCLRPCLCQSLIRSMCTTSMTSCGDFA